MKRVKILSTIMGCLFTIQVISMPALAVDVNDYTLILDECISNIMLDLEKNDVDVSCELREMIDEYYDRAEYVDIDERERLIQAAEEAEMLLAKYEAHNNGNIARGTPGVEAHYAPAIAAIVSWFRMNGYVLSAELLIHADANQIPGSIYVPVNSSVVYNSELTVSIIMSSLLDGSAEYEYSDNADLYYSIHLFDWIKQGNMLVIDDTYDYVYGDASYSDLAGQAVNMMALAQAAGAIVPYEVRIHLPM